VKKYLQITSVEIAVMIKRKIQISLSILVSSIIFILVGCGESLPEQNTEDKNMKPIYKQKTEDIKKSRETNAGVVVKNATKTSASSKTDVKSPISTQSQSAVAETATSVINYGTGYTHLSIKKKQEEKLKQIQGDYNRKLQDAIRE
jgi:hypothetical protein